mgnify:FL=1
MVVINTDQYVSDARRILANNIVYFRLQKSWTQEDLACKLGTTPVYISNIENAKRNMRIDYVDYIANIFEVPLEQLFVKRELILNHRISKK